MGGEVRGYVGHMSSATHTSLHESVMPIYRHSLKDTPYPMSLSMHAGHSLATTFTSH